MGCGHGVQAARNSRRSGGGAAGPPVKKKWHDCSRYSNAIFSKKTKPCLKWVRSTWHELILKFDGAQWLRISSKPLLTPNIGHTNSKTDPNMFLGVPRYDKPMQHRRHHFVVLFKASKIEHRVKSLEVPGILRQIHYIRPHRGWIAARAQTE